MHVWIWELDSQKAECWRTDAFELWCWRRLLRVPWTARTSNQSILKEISPEYSLEGLRLKLKFQYFGHLMQRTDSFDKTLMLGKIEVGRRRGRQRMRWLEGITALQRVGHDWATELNWEQELALILVFYTIQHCLIEIFKYHLSLHKGRSGFWQFFPPLLKGPLTEFTRRFPSSIKSHFSVK